MTVYVLSIQQICSSNASGKGCFFFRYCKDMCVISHKTVCEYFVFVFVLLKGFKITLLISISKNVISLLFSRCVIWWGILLRILSQFSAWTLCYTKHSKVVNRYGKCPYVLPFPLSLSNVQCTTGLHCPSNWVRGTSPIPGAQASASRKTRSLYSAVNRRRTGFSTTSGSGGAGSTFTSGARLD